MADQDCCLHTAPPSDTYSIHKQKDRLTGPNLASMELVGTTRRSGNSEGSALSHRGFSVVIVGGGFSGAMLAVQLLRRSPGLSIAVVENGPIPGRGVAYSTKHDCHLLNVPAGNMSAFPEDPDHFWRWARENHKSSVQATSFLPRPLYGRYVSSILEDTLGSSSADNFRWIQGKVNSFAYKPSRTGFQTNVQLQDGTTISTETIVLAMGNFPPANLNIPGLSKHCTRYFRSPWASPA